MKVQLSITDRAVIQDFFDIAKEEYGGISRLFATPLSFSDDNGVVKFRFPEWMNDIKQYLISEYGYKKAGALMLDLMAEWISEGRFQPNPKLPSEITINKEHSEDSLPVQKNVRF